MHDIAFLDDVFLAFQPQLSRLFGPGLTLERNEILISDHFGANEAALKIRVDDSGGLRRGGPRVHRPRADLLRTRREISLQTEQ